MTYTLDDIRSQHNRRPISQMMRVLQYGTFLRKSPQTQISRDPVHPQFSIQYAIMDIHDSVMVILQ